MKFLSLLLVFAGGAALGADQDPRPDMHEMAREVTSLQKYLLTDSSFTAPANEDAIKKSLGTLQKHLGHLKEKSFASDPALKANLGLLRGHIDDAARSFKDGSKPFARVMLQSSLQMCITCHTRHKAADFSWPEPEAGDVSALDRADYYFATRQFTKGKELYETVVAGYPENRTAQWNLRRALLSLAVYYARVSEDPKGGADYFEKAGKSSGLPPYLQQEAKSWGKEFSDWAKEMPEKPAAKAGAKLTEADLLKRAKKLLRHDDFTLVSELGRSFHVRRLRASALLHQVLESPGEKSPSKAEALLFLGQIYPRISSNIFFRFGEMYLKACIQDYQKTASARACYVALEALVTEGFTGSAGTDVPDDEQVELMRLKRLAY